MTEVNNPWTPCVYRALTTIYGIVQFRIMGESLFRVGINGNVIGKRGGREMIARVQIGKVEWRSVCS